MKMNLQTAKGVQDFPPEEKILRNEIVDLLKKVFEKYGFLPLETPILERYETLAAKYGGGAEILKETFKLKDQGGRKLGLRFDLTVPLARFVGMNPNLRLPFKRYEIGQVFRDGPLKLGRRREFWQCDIDTIGSTLMLAEAEILAIADEVFKRLGIDFIIKINNRKLLNGILEEVGIKKKKDEAILSVDKLEKIGEKEVKNELKKKGFRTKEIGGLLKLLKIKNLNLLKTKIKNKEGEEGIKELEELLDYLNILGLKNIEFDPFLARGLAYYTGPVFEVFLRKGEITSAIAAGGRWDKMIGSFLGRGEYPAVGIAFGLEPITEVLKKKKGVGKRTLVKVLVIPIKMEKEALKVVKKLREADIPSDIDLVGRGVSKNLEYAASLGIPYVVFVGERELKEGKVKLRNMESGNESLLTEKELINKLK